MVDQLIVPGIKDPEGKAQVKMMLSANRQHQNARQDCQKHLDWLNACKWTFFALAAVYYPVQKQHRVFIGDQRPPLLPRHRGSQVSFGTTGTCKFTSTWAHVHYGCRLLEELWIPLEHDSFSTGGKVYRHLCGPRGKDMLHAAKMQPGHAKVPSNNAEKCQLLDTRCSSTCL